MAKSSATATKLSLGYTKEGLERPMLRSEGQLFEEATRRYLPLGLITGAGNNPTLKLSTLR